MGREKTDQEIPPVIRQTAAKRANGRKQWINTAIKIFISIALILWVVRDTNLQDIYLAGRSANLYLLAIAFSLHFIGYFISAARWQTLLRVQNVDATLPYLIEASMVGIFFKNFLPSTIGGDAFRGYASWQGGASKAGAFAVIFVDRFIGMLSLMIFAVGALLFSTEITSQMPMLHLMVLPGAIGLLFVTWLIFMPSPKIATLISRVQFPFSEKVESFVSKMLDAFMAFQGRKDALAKALGLSLVLQTNVVIYYYLIAKSLGFTIALPNFFLIIPLALVIMVIPISINAIGIRENVFVFFFGFFTVTRPEALAFSWLAYGIFALHGVLGGVVYALRKNPS